jgi:hypothetical protein
MSWVEVLLPLPPPPPPLPLPLPPPPPSPLLPPPPPHLNLLHKSLATAHSSLTGTSTHDGLAIAWATARHAIQQLKCRCMFVTHYHALSLLEARHPKEVRVAWKPKAIFDSAQVRNYHMGFLEVPRKGVEAPQLVLL